MRKLRCFRVFIVSMAVLLLCICGCGCSGKPAESIDHGKILKATWDQMEDKERSEITGTWEDGKVVKATVLINDQVYHVEDEFIGVEVYLVSFPTADSAIVGELTKLVDMESLQIVGYGFRN